MQAACLVLIIHPLAGAEAFARTLVLERLAACVNRLPVSSVYRWEGAVEEAEEVLLIAKTVAGRLAELERHVHARHPYDVPEFVVLEPGHVAPPYLGWLRGEVGVQAPPGSSR
jgi:periplasmic divalent cation tolerance protein